MSESPAASESRAGGWWPEIIAVALPILFSFGALGTSQPLPPDSEVLGFLQYDQPSYYACAREVFENGNLIFAGSPWSAAPGSPRIYTNLTFTFLGVLWKLGIPFRVMDAAVRIVFGAAMMLLLVRILRVALPSARLVLPASALALAGGGLAWLFALGRCVTDTLFNRNAPGFDFSFASMSARFPALHSELEGGYADWHQSLFRSLTYAPETIYHTLFFACMLAVVRGAWRVALALIFLTWWAHPFTGIEAGFIFSAFTFFEAFVLRRIPRWPFLVSLAIHALFFVYYGWMLPLNPEHASVATQLREFGNPMLLSMLLPAYGLTIPIAAVFLSLAPARALLRDSPSARLMLCWLVCVLILVFHDRIFLFMRPMQPMHFTRGYLYVPLAYWTACGFGAMVERYPHARGWIAPLLATAFIMLHLPDDSLALGRQRELNSNPIGVYYRPKECMEFYQALDSIEEPLVIQTVWTLSPFAKFDYLIPVYTHHRTLVGHWANTPNIDEKGRLLQELGTYPSRENLLSTGLTGVITNDVGAGHLRKILDESEIASVIQWRELQCFILRPGPQTPNERNGNPTAATESE